MRACLHRVVWSGLFFFVAVALSGCSSTTPPPISVSLTPSTPQALDQNAARSVQIAATAANDNSAKGVTWSLIGPGSISSTTSTATYAPPTALLPGAQQATVKAISIADPTKTASVQITVNPYPVIQYQTLANGTVGVPYSQPVALTGGTPPVQWSVYNGGIETGFAVGGAVPDGLKLDPATGIVSGTPTAGGTWYFEPIATDADNAFGYNAFSIQINPAGPSKANAVPFLNQTLTPAAVSPGGNGTTLNVSGAGFVSTSTVDFNGTPLTTTFVDGEHLSAILPAADVATAQTASITVQTPAPGGGASNVVYLQIGAPRSTVSFANAANSPLPFADASNLAVADFNQDGKPDLAVTANERLYTMLSRGDGTFAPASGSPVSIPSPPYDDFASPRVGPVAVGDFNNSGHPGLAIVLPGNEASAVLLGNGNGTFAVSSAAFASESGYFSFAIEAADFNADGNLDLAMADESVQIALGYGKGAFNSAEVLSNAMQTFPAGVAIGDFNRDGKLDVIAVSGGTSTYPDSGWTAWLGNGDGTFTQANGSPLAVGQDLSALVAGDFNGDGKLDLAMTDYGANAVYVQLGNGDGTFQQPITIPTRNQPASIVTGDFNNDGKLDLALTNYGDNTVTLLLGNGDGTFTTASGSPYQVGRQPTSIVAADFNGDGKLDLAVANSMDGTVSILLQQ